MQVPATFCNKILVFKSVLQTSPSGCIFHNLCFYHNIVCAGSSRGPASFR